MNNQNEKQTMTYLERVYITLRNQIDALAYYAETSNKKAVYLIKGYIEETISEIDRVSATANQ